MDKNSKGGDKIETKEDVNKGVNKPGGKRL